MIEFRESTFQVPVGPHSIFEAVENGEQTWTEGALYVLRHAASNWQTGAAHKRLPHRKLAKTIGRSAGHISRLFGNLADFVTRTSKAGITGTYQLTHHNCPQDETPTDTDGAPLFCAIAFKTGGPVEKLTQGDISLEAFWVWVTGSVLGDWKTQQLQLSISAWAKQIGMGTLTLLNAIKELESAGMLKKLERHPHQAQTYQFYPCRKPEKKRPRKLLKAKGGDMRFDGKHYYSHNELYRLKSDTLEIEKRPSRTRGTWRAISDRQRHAIPRKIKEAFELKASQIQEAMQALSNFRTQQLNAQTRH